jgi:phospholipase C
MDSRRDFLKKATLLTTGSGLAGALPASIQRALAIDPSPGTTFLDAEHIVILMQENRSFDHSYGTLRGVRGFNDPRAVTLPGGLPVWLQTNPAGETYAPFRLNIKDTKATWIGSLPHDWPDQSDARNRGRHDRWLEVKRSGKRDYAHLPLTLGYYNREDIPFYYAFADAFTVCDQNFCSSLTGTTPNRLHLWTGTIREKPAADAKACVRNSDADYDTAVAWKTFPERLEDAGVSWCIYQNELSITTGFTTEEDGWLANYGDNPIEYFSQFKVRFSPSHRKYLAEAVKTLPGELAKLEAAPRPWSDAFKKRVASTRARLAEARRGIEIWTEENFAKLTPRERELHRKAFRTNESDPDYRQLATLSYEDGGAQRQMRVPKGDLFRQFREDVRTGKLPAVSWIVAPENFSDHPSAPWYGAWYVSEALDALTQNPEVWKKTIFILCYDENDGYFDHVPPFVPPHPDRPESGKTSAALNAALEQVGLQLNGSGHTGPIGLGYRVPLVIASPWSRGGYVCSQVFDHTSILQLLEKILSHRAGQAIREPNITAWRRTVCGDLSSVFRPYAGERFEAPKPVVREEFLRSIHKAQFQQVPNGFHRFTPEEARQAAEAPRKSPWLPRQEPGTRPSCALPYELAVEGALSADRKSFVVRLAAGCDFFGARAAGAPFHVYAPAKMRVAGTEPVQFGPGLARAYAVSPGDRLEDRWTLADFEDGTYHLCVHGPNGFFREFRGNAGDPDVEMALQPVLQGKAPTGNVTLVLNNRDPKRAWTIVVDDSSYGGGERKVTLGAAGAKDAHAELTFDLQRSHRWYDLRIRVVETPGFEVRYAGRVETGEESVSDPAMG